MVREQQRTSVTARSSPFKLGLCESLPCQLARADAVPKKRGPKTDVLEALLKRVDGLEAKLKNKKEQPGQPASEAVASATEEASSSSAAELATTANRNSTEDDDAKPQPVIDTARAVDVTESAVYTPTSSRYDAYSRTHG